MSNNLPKFTIRQLLEAGVHFGHKTMRWNPKMEQYIYGTRNKLHIIDLEQTAKLLHKSLHTLSSVAKRNGKILFVATKKQAAQPVADAAERCGQYYVNDRWLGGMLTNWKTVTKTIKKLEKMERQLADENSGLNKKERLVLERNSVKMQRTLNGIRNMGGYPDVVVVIDSNKEHLAIKEAEVLGIPVMSILDTNSNPEGIAYPIPGNDDSLKAIKLYCDLFSNAVLAGMKESAEISGAAKEGKTIVKKKPAAKTTKKAPAPAKAKVAKAPAKKEEAKTPAKVEEKAE